MTAGPFDVEVGLDGGSEGAGRVEALRTGPLAVGLLPVARRQVVGDRVAEDVVEGVGGRHVLGDATDDGGELALEADEVRALRQHDGVAGPDHGGVGLEEQHRRGRHVVAELRGMVAVVAADADQLRARDDRGEQGDVGERHALPRRVVPGEHRVAGEDDEFSLVDDSELDGVVVAEARDPHRISLAICPTPPARHGQPRARAARRARGIRRTTDQASRRTSQPWRSATRPYWMPVSSSRNDIASSDAASPSCTIS